MAQCANLIVDGGTIENIACGKLSGSYTGAVYVSGTLLFKSGSITGNTLADGTTASDVWLADQGVFKLSSTATVGTVVLADKTASASSKIEVTAPLQQGFQARSATYLGILQPDLDSGRIVAVDSYTLSEEDYKKIAIADSKSVVLKFKDSQAVVGRLYERSHGELNGSGTHRLPNVNYGSWYGLYVDWWAEVGITKGIDNKHFAPRETVTRAEVAAMIQRFITTIVLETKDDRTV